MMNHPFHIRFWVPGEKRILCQKDLRDYIVELRESGNWYLTPRAGDKPHYYSGPQDPFCLPVFPLYGSNVPDSYGTEVFVGDVLESTGELDGEVETFYTPVYYHNGVFWDGDTALQESREYASIRVVGNVFDMPGLITDPVAKKQVKKFLNYKPI